MQKALLFILFVFAAFQAKAQVFYECKSLNGDTTFYLMGTCHYLPKTAKFDTILLGNYIRNCDVVFSEMYIDDGDISYKTALSNLGKNKRYKNDGLLKDSVTKIEYQRIFSYYHSRFGVSKKQFNWASYYRPWAMDSRLRHNLKENYSMDHILYAIAKAARKTVRNLDNEDLLYAASSKLNSVFDINWLLFMVNGEKITMTDDEIIAQSYLKQDTARILKQLSADPEHQRYLIDDRNRHWLTVFEKYCGRTNFVYCGLAHVISGQYALLNYFRSKHYSVKAIDVNLPDFR
jgi:uncharacterized protein YbaP (TraB family)